MIVSIDAIGIIRCRLQAASPRVVRSVSSSYCTEEAVLTAAGGLGRQEAV